MTPTVELLRTRSVWAHPVNAAHQQRWIHAARYLRQRGIWIIDARISRKCVEAAQAGLRG